MGTERSLEADLHPRARPVVEHIRAATEASQADYGALFESTCGLVQPASVTAPSAMRTATTSAAKKLQDLGAQVVMSAADWELLERSEVDYPKPRRDIVASDAQALTLGDTTTPHRPSSTPSIGAPPEPRIPMWSAASRSRGS